MNENNQEQTDQKTSEKERFFKTINDFIVTSGVVAAGIKAVTNGIATQVEKTKREAQKKALISGLACIGLIFVFIGTVQLITHYFDLSLYTNLIIGGVLFFAALVIKICYNR